MKHIYVTYFQPFERIELIEPFELFLTQRQEVFVSRKARKGAKSAKWKTLPTTNYKQSKEQRTQSRIYSQHQTTNTKQ